MSTHSVKKFFYLFRYILDQYKTRQMRHETVNTYHSTNKFIIECLMA